MVPGMATVRDRLGLRPGWAAGTAAGAGLQLPSQGTQPEQRQIEQAQIHGDLHGSQDRGQGSPRAVVLGTHQKKVVAESPEATPCLCTLHSHHSPKVQ